LREPLAKFIETEMGSDILLITCGLPGTWKTETSEEISKIKGYPILRSDLIRLEVLKNEDIFDEKVASDMSKRMVVYDETFRRADEALEKGDSVILDATFITQSLRRRAAAIAAKHDKTFVILQTHCLVKRYSLPYFYVIARSVSDEAILITGEKERIRRLLRSARNDKENTASWHL